MVSAAEVLAGEVKEEVEDDDEAEAEADTRARPASIRVVHLLRLVILML